MKMNPKTHAVISCIILVLTASTGHAEGRLIDYAQVTQVTPVYHRIEERVPKEHCWIDRVRQETHYRQSEPAEGKLVGGIIGGALGHAVGHGSDNKKIGAVVGTVLGASLGHRVDRQASRPAQTHVSYRNVERCEIKHVMVTRRELVGYDVSYRYDERNFFARMSSHPGDRIRVAVQIEPVDS